MTKAMHHTKHTPRPSSWVSHLCWILCIAFFILCLANLWTWSQVGYAKTSATLSEQHQALWALLAIKNPTMVHALMAMKQKVTFLLPVQRLAITPHLPKLQVSQSNELNLSQALENSKAFLLMLFLTGKTLFLKALSLCLSICLYLFALLMGAMDGFVKRYQRTAEGGRESTFVFHHFRHWLGSLPLWIILAYLILPVTVLIDGINVCIAFLIFAYAETTTSQLKKYL